jgi:hypothetical protein
MVEADFVEAVDQAVLAEGVDLEREAVLERGRHGLRFEVDVDGLGLRHFHQAVDRLLREDHGDDAVLEGVAGEDIREGRRDDGLDAEIEQRPRCVFTAGTAAEVVARDEDRRALELGAVEDVVRILAQRLERAAAKAFAADRLEPCGEG